MSKPEEESSEVKNSSRNILILDVLGMAVIFILFMIVRDKFGQIFKEMDVPATLSYRILIEPHPVVLIVEFIIIIAILILKERVIRNKSITYYINSIILVVLVLSILFFGYSAFFLPLIPLITELQSRSSFFDKFGYLFSYNIVVPLVILIAGLIIFIKPVSCIELQKKFYEKINWRMEPINMEMEIRNTKIMGLFLVGASLATIVYFLIKG